MEKFANPLSEEAESYDETALGESAAADDTGKPSAALSGRRSFGNTSEDSTQPGGNLGIMGAFAQNFMGHSPVWYKIVIVTCLCINPILRVAVSKESAAWALLIEFVFTLFMATDCYPLQPGGVLVIQGYVMGLATAHRFKHEVETNINVILLVIFMVSCIHFMKALLLWIFTDLLVKIENKTLLSLAMLAVCAMMSAFLDALSVAAVIVSVCTGVLGVYYHVVENADLPLLDNLHHETMSYELVPHVPNAYGETTTPPGDSGGGSSTTASQEAASRHAAAPATPPKQIGAAGRQTSFSGSPVFDAAATPSSFDQEKDPGGDKSPRTPRTRTTSDASSTGQPSSPPSASSPTTPVEPVGAQAYGLHKADIVQFRQFLRSLLMHGAIGTAIGGSTTLVGEPQNLVIARNLDWDFGEFFLKMLPVSALSIPAGWLTCVVLEQSGVLGYGVQMPLHVRQVLTDFTATEYSKIHNGEAAELAVQIVAGILLVLGLALNVTEVGFVGLGIAVLITVCNGITEEHEIAHAFLEAMPFVSLLVVFFAVVAIIKEQAIFEPIIEAVLKLEPLSAQAPALFVANGVLSAVSDNMFVATVFIEGVATAYHDTNPATINVTEGHFGDLAVAINMGTNLASCASPNGQAAFLFILLSAIAPLIDLSYAQMMLMAAPYAVALSLSGLVGIAFLI